jgi:quinolinate synthase
MAESANILGAPHQQVLLPDLAAGCSMADMAAIDQLEICWEEMRAWAPRASCPSRTSIHPPTSKASAARTAGIVCTSSNAAKVMGWA